MESSTTQEDWYFDHILASIQASSTSILDAYTCDLTTVPTVVNVPTPRSSLFDTPITAISDKPKSNRPPPPRRASMVQVQGISAYPTPGKKRRTHERMASTGIHVRLPNNVRFYDSNDKPPTLTRTQQLDQTRKKYDPNYVLNMLTEAKEARIHAEHTETELTRTASKKLQHIRHEERLMVKQSEREIVRKNVLNLAERQAKERQGVVVDSNGSEDVMYELWNRRNSLLLKKKSERHPERNDGSNGVVSRYLQQVKQSSAKHVDSARRRSVASLNRIDMYGLMGVKRKVVVPETEATVASVFR